MTRSCLLVVVLLAAPWALADPLDRIVPGGMVFESVEIGEVLALIGHEMDIAIVKTQGVTGKVTAVFPNPLPLRVVLDAVCATVGARYVYRDDGGITVQGAARDQARDRAPASLGAALPAGRDDFLDRELKGGVLVGRLPIDFILDRIRVGTGIAFTKTRDVEMDVETAFHEPVSVREVLDYVCQSAGLRYIPMEGDTVRLSSIEPPDADGRSAEYVVKRAYPMPSGDADTLALSLQAMLTPDFGQLTVDASKREIVVSDLETVQRRIEQRLQAATPQTQGSLR